MMLEEKQLKQAVMSFLEQAFNEDSAFKDKDVAPSQFFIYGYLLPSIVKHPLVFTSVSHFGIKAFAPHFS